MLSKQHQFATHITDTSKRKAYKMHMCGLCHALGDSYGLLARWLTSHEMILLNMLTRAQRETVAPAVIRRCPLNPMLTVSTNQDNASQFAAAVAVGLAKVSVADDVQDSGGRDLIAQLASQMLKRANRTALQTLENLGFDTETLLTLSERQTIVENDDTQEPVSPSAITSANLFAMTAHLAGNPENEEVLSVIGANYGAYLYLIDAYRDYPRDIVKGDFNPLRRFTQKKGSEFTLSIEGITWLLARFEEIRASIRQKLNELTLYHYHDMIAGMLLDPLNAIVASLSQQRRSLTFQQRGLSDVVKSILFVLPPALAGAGLTGAYQAGEPHLDELEDIPKRKKKRQQNQQDDYCFDGWLCYYPGGGCGDCGSGGSGSNCDASSVSGCGSCYDDHHGDGAAVRWQAHDQSLLIMCENWNQIETYETLCFSFGLVT